MYEGWQLLAGAVTVGAGTTGAGAGGGGVVVGGGGGGAAVVVGAGAGVVGGLVVVVVGSAVVVVGAEVVVVARRVVDVSTVVPVNSVVVVCSCRSLLAISRAARPSGAGGASAPATMLATKSTVSTPVIAHLAVFSQGAATHITMMPTGAQQIRAGTRKAKDAYHGGLSAVGSGGVGGGDAHG